MSSVALCLTPLDAFAVSVEREHGEVTRHIAAALRHALAAGDALLGAQAELRDEASFERWVEARGLHYRTAQKYMRLASYRDRLEALPEFGDLSVNRAQLYLRGLPKRVQTDEQNEATVAEIKRLHSDGVGSREIARALGCSRSTVRYHTEPGFREVHNGRRPGQISRSRAADRAAETERRLEIRGGPLVEAHHALVAAEDKLVRAKDSAKSIDERRDVQRSIDSVTEARHWLARAIRSDLAAARRPKVRHPQTESAA